MSVFWTNCLSVPRLGGQNKKKILKNIKKSSFALLDSPLSPPPLLVDCPLKNFFCNFPYLMNPHRKCRTQQQRRLDSNRQQSSLGHPTSLSKNVYCMVNVLCGTYAEKGSAYLLSLIYSATESGSSVVEQWAWYPEDVSSILAQTQLFKNFQISWEWHCNALLKIKLSYTDPGWIHGSGFGDSWPDPES